MMTGRPAWGDDAVMAEPTTYEIVIRGHLGPRLLRPLLDDFVLDRPAEGTTRLTGTIVDPAHLHGVLAHLTAVAVEVVSIGPAQQPTRQPSQPNPGSGSAKQPSKQPERTSE